MLDLEGHRSLALWAVDCAEHVLAHFEDACPDDDRPRRAVEAGRAWARGELKVGEVRDAALAAHGRAAIYAVTAATYAAAPADAAAATSREREWQAERLPKHLRTAAYPGRGEG
jgi:Imm-5 like putative immunity protein